jgi:hypothetical protein
MRQLTVIGMVVLIGMLDGTAWAQGHARMIMVDQGQAAPMPLPVPPPMIGYKVEMLAVEPFEMGDAVENAPFSAEIVNVFTQELPDGNRIERRTTGLVARDSRGRVRREHQLAAIGPVVPDGDARMVTISDPVAGIHLSLDPGRKTALGSRPPRVRAESEGHVSVEGRAAPMFFDKRVGPAPGLEVRGKPEASDGRTKQLGTKEYEGVRAEGTRTIATLPAGAIGNVRPIEVVSERWYSPDLRVVVFSRRADPRFGETVYRLTNITLAEPDASLFEVPADYDRKDVKPLPFEPPIEPGAVRPLP